MKYGTYRGHGTQRQMQNDLAGGGVIKKQNAKKVLAQRMEQEASYSPEYRAILSPETQMRLELLEKGRNIDEIP